MPPALCIWRGTQRARLHALTSAGLTVGRAVGNDLLLKDARVSSKH